MEENAETGHEKCALLACTESQDSLGVWGTDVSYGAVKCSPNEREFPVFGPFGHEPELTKTLPYQLPFIYDFD